MSKELVKEYIEVMSKELDRIRSRLRLDMEVALREVEELRVALMRISTRIESGDTFEELYEMEYRLDNIVGELSRLVRIGKESYYE